MKVKKFSELVAVTGLTGTELIPIIQAGGDKTTTPNMIMAGIVLTNYLPKINPVTNRCLTVNASTGETVDIHFSRNNQDRWLLYVDNAPEASGNTGSDLRIYRFDNTGGYVDNVLQVHRNTGIFDFACGINIKGTDVTATALEINQLSGVTSLIQTQLDSKLGSLSCANDSAKLGGYAKTYFLNTGSTIFCGCVPASFLLSGGTAVNSLKLGGQLPAYYLNTGSTALCATTAGNALKLNNKLPAFYLNTGSTALCATTAGNALALCGCVPANFLGAASTACNSLGLCGCVPSCFLAVGGTAVCATNSACLGAQLPAYYLPTNGSINTLSCTSYGLVAADCGKTVEFTTTASTSIYLPTGLTVGFQANIVNVGGGNKTFCACTGSNLHSLCSKVILAGAYNMATLYYRCINNWVIAGNLC